MEQQQQQTAMVVQHLDVIAAKARKGLRKVAEGEDKTMDGWLEYGAALNEGRKQFDGDREFGEWVALSQLGTRAEGDDIKRDDRLAAMWAAGYPEQFRETKKANPRVRTVRGLHAKWKANAELKDKPAPAKVEPTEEDLKTMGRLKTLSERGATEGERASAQAKLEAYSSAFGDDQDEVIEKATEAAEQEQDREPDSVVIQKFHNRLKRKDQDWLIDQLLWAMHKDHEIFKTIAERLFAND